MPRCSLMSNGTPFLISKLKFSYNKYSLDKVWTKICCHFYFRGITLRSSAYTSQFPQEGPEDHYPNVVLSHALYGRANKHLWRCAHCRSHLMDSWEDNIFHIGLNDIDSFYPEDKEEIEFIH